MTTTLSIFNMDEEKALTALVARLMTIADLCRDICSNIGDFRLGKDQFVNVNEMRDLIRQSEALLASFMNSHGDTWAAMTEYINRPTGKKLTRQALHRRLGQYGAEVTKRAYLEYNDNIKIINAIGDINFPKRNEIRKTILYWHNFYN